MAKNKSVEVETQDPRLFKALMGLMTRDTVNGEYKVFFRDLCKFLGVNPAQANDSLNLNYFGNRQYQVPHFELPEVQNQNACVYIETGDPFTYSSDDRYYISWGDTIALAHGLLELIKDKTVVTNFNEVLAVNVSNGLADCFRYASQFDTTLP